MIIFNNSPRIKNGSYTHQGIYMTTIYDEMPRMTDEEIAEWKRDVMENRIREALAQIRMVKSTLIDMANLSTHDKVSQAEGLSFTLESCIQDIINELPERDSDS